MAYEHTDDNCDFGNTYTCPGERFCGGAARAEDEADWDCPLDGCTGSIAYHSTFDPFDRIACGLCPPGKPCQSCALTIHEMGCSRALAATTP